MKAHSRRFESGIPRYARGVSRHPVRSFSPLASTSERAECPAPIIFCSIRGLIGRRRFSGSRTSSSISRALADLAGFFSATLRWRRFRGDSAEIASWEPREMVGPKPSAKRRREDGSGL